MLQGLRDAVDALNAVDVDGLSDTELHELVTGLQREGERLEAAQARLLARWDARCVWADDGSKSPGARLARETESGKGQRLPAGEAGPAAVVDAARRCRVRGWHVERRCRGPVGAGQPAPAGRAV